MLFNFGSYKVQEEEKKALVSKVFAKVADKYTLMNNLMSFGIQKMWKLSFTDLISLKSEGVYIDLACGNGDISRYVSQKAINEGKNIAIHLCDPSSEMLEIGKKNLSILSHKIELHFHNMFAEELSFPPDSVDSIFISFGIRNFTNLPAALSKMHSCLKKGGSIYILEFFPDVSTLLGFSKIYKSYLTHIIPKIGKIVVKDSSPYEYFAESIINFLTKEEFKNLFLKYNFKLFNVTSSAFKIVSFFQFKK